MRRKSPNDIAIESVSGNNQCEYDFKKIYVSDSIGM